jgi:hypothetical protein
MRRKGSWKYNWQRPLTDQEENQEETEEAWW